MSELPTSTSNNDPAITHADIRANLDVALANMAAYDPDASLSIPTIDRNFAETISGPENVPIDILVDYTTLLKFEEDALSQYGKREPNYWSKLEQIGKIDAVNLHKLYETDGETNPLRAMLTQQVSKDYGSSIFLKPAFDVVKKVHGASTIPGLTHTHPDDPTLGVLRHALRSGNVKIYDFFSADTKDSELARGSQELRVWMRDALQMATDITDPEQADMYTYANSRSTWGAYTLGTLVDRINSYGSDKLAAIKDFANISALSPYSDKQLERMFKLSQGDEGEIAYLKEHDVSVMLINMDGDHNGVSAEVADRLDDDAERMLFFEISKPHQVYAYLKKLHDLGILPTTLIFASHGSAGQYFIGERPSLDSDQTMDHVTVVIDQELADHIATNEQNLKGYDIANANGLIRSIQRFMQPSRAIDDPDKDLGRKKIISLSCQFDGEAHRASLGPDGEKVKGEKTTLLRRLGEVIVDRLANEHIDIYGARISTNKQTRTERGFHYNQMIDGRWEPYPSSVLHVDGKDIQWHRLNEVQLRKG